MTTRRGLRAALRGHPAAVDVKTPGIYSHGVKLLNVRLGPEDARMATALRTNGIQLSQLIRQAIRTEYARRLAGRVSRRRPSDIVREITAAHPDPADLPARADDVHQRRTARSAIQARLRRGRR